MNAEVLQRFRAPPRQRGAVLFVSLIILLALSLVAISTANTALLEQKMTSATRNMQLARLAADSALNEAKVRVSEMAGVYGAAAVCAHLRCFIRAPGAPYAAEELMQTEPAQAAMNPFRLDLTQLQGPDASARLAASPAYLIEDLGATTESAGSPPSGEADSSRRFRITAIGYGGRRDYQRVIESVYSVAK